MQSMSRRAAESAGKETGKIVREINQVTRGWGNYFAHANDHRCFWQMNDFIAHRLRQWLWRKHGNPAGKCERWPSRNSSMLMDCTNSEPLRDERLRKT